MAGTFEQALGKALRFLARRDRLVAEVRQHLSDYPEEVRDQVVAHLDKKRILDDNRAAEAFARSRNGRKAIGVAALKHQLQQRGASEQVLATLPVEQSDLQRALCVLESKFRPDPMDRARAGRLLSRRGFEEDDISAALESFFGSENGIEEPL